MLRSQLTGVPPGLFHHCGIEGQLIWSSLQPTTTAKQFEALKPAATFFFTISNFNQTRIDG